MAILQKLLRSALCSERTLLASSARCMSRLQCRQSSPVNLKNINQNNSFHENISKNISASSSCPTGVEKTISNSLLQRLDIILPMSPVEQLIKLKLPTISKEISLEMPTTKASLDNAHIIQKIGEMHAPQRGKIIKQLAIRMLVIRRRKMKKHQRKKFLKKFRIQRMTLKKKRFLIREAAFLSGLEGELKLGEAFDAEQFAADKIKLAFQPLPTKEKLLRPLPWEFQPLFFISKKNGK